MSYTGLSLKWVSCIEDERQHWVMRLISEQKMQGMMMMMMEAVRATNPMTADRRPHPKGFLCRLSQPMCALPSPLYLLHTALTFLQLFSILIPHTVTPLYNVPSQPLLGAPFFRRHKRLIITWHIDVDILSKGFISMSLYKMSTFTCLSVVTLERVNPQPITVIMRPCCLHPYIPLTEL